MLWGPLLRDVDLPLSLLNVHTWIAEPFSILGGQFLALLVEGQTPNGTITKMQVKLNLKINTLPAPCQNIDAVNTFVLPHLIFALSDCHVPKSKSWLNLLQRSGSPLCLQQKGWNWTPYFLRITHY